MPLVPLTLQQDLEQLHDAMMLITDPAEAKTYHATQLSLIITNYIKTAVVTTAGTATTQTGTLS